MRRGDSAVWRDEGFECGQREVATVMENALGLGTGDVASGRRTDHREFSLSHGERDEFPLRVTVEEGDDFLSHLEIDLSRDLGLSAAEDASAMDDGDDGAGRGALPGFAQLDSDLGEQSGAGIFADGFRDDGAVDDESSLGGKFREGDGRGSESAEQEEAWNQSEERAAGGER